MNILGIDYGQKNIGLAWMQEGLDVVLPFGVIQVEKNKEQAIDQQIKELKTLIEEQNIGIVVIGLPLTLEDGAENGNTQRVRAFGDSVKKKIGLPVTYVDERLTSFEADQMGGDASRDEKAAMVILQTYKKQMSI